MVAVPRGAVPALACLLSLALFGFAWAQPYAIHWHADATPASVEVTGLSAETVQTLGLAARADADWAALFAVFAEQGGDAVMPPMAGRWSAAENALRFEPRFPLAPGLRYRAEFHPVGGTPVIAYFTLPPDRAPPTTAVTRIFPSADVLPENQLKFYVQFSAPMSRGAIYEHIHLRDEAGRAIALPFLELDEELWDPSMTRLTLLIDPGRIKRGVKPLEDVGPVFETDKRYTLVVDATCRDAVGRPLRAAFAKPFQAGPADRTPPDPQRWKITPAAAGTRAPLTVEFDEPMDQALALRLIDVVTAADGVVQRGQATLENEERRWRFVPERAWARGVHRLTVATTIEDLAGNNIGKTFDVDLAAGAKRRVGDTHVSVPFEVR